MKHQVILLSCGIVLLIAMGCGTNQQTSRRPSESPTAPRSEDAAPGGEVAAGLPAPSPKRGPRPGLETRARGRISPKKLSGFLRELVARPHPASSEGSRKQARFLAAQLESWGYQVERQRLEVLLPFPRRIRVEMLAPFAYSCGLRERPVDEDADTFSKDVLPPYNAYSPEADITAPLVYAYYGRREDYESLKQQGVPLHGALALVRYGRSFRGSKVKIAEEFGLAGVLLYSDPADDGFARGDVYPKGPYRPETGVQRGSILYLFEYPGDPGTPGRPSLPGAEQLPYGQMKSLPTIPCTCLSAEDAKPLLENLKGPVAPRAWRGALPFTYHLGGRGEVKVRLVIRNDEALRPIENIIATWVGLEHPDEEILLGNHRDAWVFGANDAGSGTAVLLEVARVFADTVRQGRAPARTVRFCFWDAEEFGMIGSTEYGESRAEELKSKAIVYLNLDAAVSGPHLRVAGSPSLRPLIKDILASCQNEKRAPLLSEVTDKSGGMTWGRLGSGSDFTVFLDHLGVPSLDLASSGAHGVYHSLYDTYAFMKRFGDPGFQRHTVMASVTLTTLLRLAYSGGTPLAFGETGHFIVEDVRALEAEHPNLDLGEIRELGKDIASIGERIDVLRSQLDSKGALSSARWEILRKLSVRAHQALLLDQGLPGRTWYRHVLFAPSRDKGYGAAPLPALSDALAKGDRRAVEAGAALTTERLRAHRAALREMLATLEAWIGAAPRATGS